MALCSPHAVSYASFAKRNRNITRRKNSLSNLTWVNGDRDVETPTPGMLRKPGDLHYPCPRPKKFKGLATRDTLYGSRPDPRQRDPNDRIVPTPSDVSVKGASTKRCALEEKKTILRIHVYIHKDSSFEQIYSGAPRFSPGRCVLCPVPGYPACRGL